MMAKAPRGATRRTAAAPASSAAPAAAAAPAQAAPIAAASTPPASAPAAPVESPPAPAPELAEAKAPVEAPAKSGKVRWLRMETGLSGPELSLARGDKHPFCDIPGDDDAPSEAQRLVDAGFAVDCDPPAEG